MSDASEFDQGRTVVWFSCGAASAVTAKIVLAQSATPDKVVLAYTDPGSEHEDNVRFRADCERWFDHQIIRLKSTDYVDTWDVWHRRRFIVSRTGSPCTLELKKRVRQRFERPDDVQYYGYHAKEVHRAVRFRAQNPEVDLRTPLIDAGLTKEDCLAIVDRAGLVLPAMYLLGYENNNCIGCPKGGIGYWNKIRRDFPATFDRMAAQEREVGSSVLHEEEGLIEVYEDSIDDEPGETVTRLRSRRSMPLWLDELDPDRGNYADEPSFECSLLCVIAESEIAGAVQETEL